MITYISFFIILILIIIFINNKKEFFNTNINLVIPNPLDNNTNVGFHTKVDVNDYDINRFGPKCLNTCIIEHIQKINWGEVNSNDSYSRENILQYNRDNPSTDNYCHSANIEVTNDNRTVKQCTNNCSSQCGESSGNYSHCTNTNNFCEENTLNYISGGSILAKSQCANKNDNSTNNNYCINKYWKNIQTLKDVYDNNNQ